MFFDLVNGKLSSWFFNLCRRIRSLIPYLNSHQNANDEEIPFNYILTFDATESAYDNYIDTETSIRYFDVESSSAETLDSDALSLDHGPLDYGLLDYGPLDPHDLHTIDTHHIWWGPLTH
ncbi:hypothetical protein N7532_000053 [Penicillium argentinense]|uniref:Uncharacterized protein n=1 Tax=Penicillium argentinense TaxID=1131581 RepID=A0A9W9G4W0_9EURO|nr:uncharacterized protein N7532_000053 [Penicillium argentinense]KAJ5112008.1 hypothetical protein N7532_000053 [Penicillium argentinense]